MAAAAAAALAAWSVAHAAGLFIRQHDLRFSEREVALHVGDLLTFTNEDTVTHNIGVRGGPSGDTQDLGLQKPGVSVGRRFDAPGDFTVVCSIHPRMRLKVSVQR